MSLLEEPAAKVSKLSGPRNTEDETEDDLYEGQEEWLSEEVLTDEDEYQRMLGEDNSKPVTKTAKSQVKKKPVTDDDEEVRRPRTRSKVMMKSREQKAIAKDISGSGGDMDSTSADDASALKKMFVSNKKKDAGNDKQTSNGVKKNTSGNKSTTTANKNVKSNQNMALRNRDDKDMDSEDVSLDMQSLMKPEEMDEEVPSDCETESEADSLYDDFPTTDSEDMNEWFTLDIREERAGDYIPLLGSKAVQLLSEEKQRVLDRLSSLRESLSVMSETGKDQTELLKKATATLSELDAALKFA
ncbi:unnamed protein product [Leptidea sinapis]|uniref:Uncharacterized protein n=1 Tax=Leptidea sinapis TaxID=189913 RepID=A0A5E4R2B1_9NEOP|nr:unnamed protein product [Leptidea sinapis]